ncbi:MAG TPA: hypothetical protein EYN06_02875 [Myxococcales bacterium]|nr:hypothetical protein [Myxococcales bacterium]
MVSALEFINKSGHVNLPSRKPFMALLRTHVKVAMHPLYKKTKTASRSDPRRQGFKAMATLEFTRSHNTTIPDAVTKIRDVIDDFQARYSKYINTVSWGSDGQSAQASGKRFKAHFSVDDSSVRIQVELVGLLTRVLKPKVESKIVEKLDQHFPL